MELNLGHKVCHNSMVLLDIFFLIMFYRQLIVLGCKTVSTIPLLTYKVLFAHVVSRPRRLQRSTRLPK